MANRLGSTKEAGEWQSESWQQVATVEHGIKTESFFHGFCPEHGNGSGFRPNHPYAFWNRW
jgi:hypothetical protein